MSYQEDMYNVKDPRKFELFDPEDGRRLICTGFEDVNWHIHCFEEVMKEQGHESTVSLRDDLVPRRPFGAFGRRDMDPAYPGPPQPEDEDRISKYLPAVARHNKSNAQVVASILNTCDTVVQQDLDAQIVNLRAKTRENYHEIVRMMRLLYGQWTSFKGTKNFMSMQEIGVFLDRKSTIEGLRQLNVLRRERDSWVGLMAGAQLYDDSFYRPWLLSRMRSWAKLDWYANSFQSQPLLTYNDMKIALLAHIKRMHEEDMEARLQHGPARPAQPAIADSTAYSYESVNSATQQLTGQVYDLTQQIREMRASASTYSGQEQDMSKIKCFNCDEIGHISRDCKKARRQVAKYGNRQQQQQGRQRQSVPSYVPHPDAKAAMLSGNKRAFNPGVQSTGSKRPYVPDPSKARYPALGTGKYSSSVSAAYTENDGCDTISDYSYTAHHVNVMMEQQDQDEALDGEDDGF